MPGQSSRQDEETVHEYPDTETIPVKVAPIKPCHLAFRSVLQPGVRWEFRHSLGRRTRDDAGSVLLELNK